MFGKFAFFWFFFQSLTQNFRQILGVIFINFNNHNNILIVKDIENFGFYQITLNILQNYNLKKTEGFTDHYASSLSSPNRYSQNPIHKL